MSDYHAPTRDMRFVIEELLDLDGLARLRGFEEVTPDVITAILDEAARLGSEVLAPLNRSGDVEGARLRDGRITVPAGFEDAYARYTEGGWNGVAADVEQGGMGLPELVATATQEIWQSANMAFALCPMLTAGAIEALARHGSEWQREVYLERLVSGVWCGTMDLTEPQAGSDLSAVRTRAVPDGERYRLFGQKIYVTWGEHEMAENIVHLVLARTADSPAGVKGISLFLVPKWLPTAEGGLGERNDLHCAAIEHKLGIHASPTCTIAFGDSDGAIGYRVGEEGRGLEYMFTMMNEARHKVGVQGLAIAERAYQQAVAYARERVQGRPLGASDGDAAIIHHPDVRRMLMTMRAQIEAMRALCYACAAAMDRARREPDTATAASSQARVDFLIPVVKSWCTELGVEVASLGIQVHGGMGYVEETGAAQHLRDARIAPIYEGTNGIQANDLVGRKLLRDKGRALKALLDDIQETVDRLEASTAATTFGLRRGLEEAVEMLEQAGDWLLERGPDDPVEGAANSHAFLMLVGYVTGGWLMARAALGAETALAADTGDRRFYECKKATARFYFEQILPRAIPLRRAVTAGARGVMALSDDAF